MVIYDLHDKGSDGAAIGGYYKAIACGLV